MPVMTVRDDRLSQPDRPEKCVLLTAHRIKIVVGSGFLGGTGAGSIHAPKIVRKCAFGVAPSVALILASAIVLVVRA